MPDVAGIAESSHREDGWFKQQAAEGRPGEYVCCRQACKNTMDAGEMLFAARASFWRIKLGTSMSFAIQCSIYRRHTTTLGLWRPLACT